MIATKYQILLSILIVGVNRSLAFAPIAKSNTFLSTNAPTNTLYDDSRAFLLSATSSDESEINVQDFGDVGFVLLAGGTGSRMKANMPKQFMTLKGMPVLHHSLDLFLNRLPAFASGHGLR